MTNEFLANLQEKHPLHWKHHVFCLECTFMASLVLDPCSNLTFKTLFILQKFSVILSDFTSPLPQLYVLAFLFSL